MQDKTKKNNKGSFLLKIAILCFAGFLVFTLIGQQVSIGQKRTELNEINEKLELQQIKNDELEHNLSQELELEEYAEKAARRDLNYAKPEEKVFVNIGGVD